MSCCTTRQAVRREERSRFQAEPPGPPPTTIKAATPGTVTLISTNTPEDWQDMVSLGAQSYIVLDGFVIDGQHRPTNWNAVGARGSYIRISNSELKNVVAQGLWAPNATHHKYLHLHIHHAGWNGRTTTCPPAVCQMGPGIMCDHYCHGYYGSGSDNRMEDSTVHDNNGHGIQWYGSNGIIKNNRVYDATQGQEIGIGVYGRGNQVEGNVLVRNGVHMIAGQAPVKNTLCGHRTDTGWNGIIQQPGQRLHHCRQSAAGVAGGVLYRRPWRRPLGQSL